MRKNCCDKNPPICKIYKGFVILLILFIILYFLYENSSLFYRKSINLPLSLHLNKQELYMLKGEEAHLFVYGINKRVKFYSTDFKVAGVNFNGRVFAYNTGKAFIIARVNDKELKCRVYVIDINKDTLELKTGHSYGLKVKGKGSLVSWKSSNKAVATVNIFGKVKAKRKGRTTITGRIKGKTLKCIVTVK